MFWNVFLQFEALRFGTNRVMRHAYQMLDQTHRVTRRLDNTTGRTHILRRTHVRSTLAKATIEPLCKKHNFAQLSFSSQAFERLNSPAQPSELSPQRKMQNVASIISAQPLLNLNL